MNILYVIMQLKNDLDGLLSDKNALEKKLKGAEDDMNIKAQMIEQLKSNLREKVSHILAICFFYLISFSYVVTP